MVTVRNRNDLALLVGLGAAGYFAWRYLNDGTDPGIDDLPQDVGPVTLSKAQLVLMADGLEAALLGGWFGEDETAVETIIAQCATDGDVLSLVKEFGIRCEGVMIRRCGSLPQWFIIYLSDDERAGINDILEANGITYRF